jgi:hypothetical protein
MGADREKERHAAFRDGETRLVNAWKSEFQQQLAFAASHLPTTKPRTPEDRVAVNDLIKLLKKMLSGRPHGRIRSLTLAAERAAATLTRERLQRWCKENGRRRAGARKLATTVANAIKTIAFQFHVPVSEIRPDEVRRLATKKGGISAK